jgi:hypothetical protein
MSSQEDTRPGGRGRNSYLPVVVLVLCVPHLIFHPTMALCFNFVSRMEPWRLREVKSCLKVRAGKGRAQILSRHRNRFCPSAFHRNAFPQDLRLKGHDGLGHSNLACTLEVQEPSVSLWSHCDPGKLGDTVRQSFPSLKEMSTHFIYATEIHPVGQQINLCSGIREPCKDIAWGGRTSVPLPLMPRCGELYHFLAFHYLQ